MGFGSKRRRDEEPEAPPPEEKWGQVTVPALSSPRPQVVGQANVDRTRHVWYKTADGRFKCVLCGGVATELKADAEPERIETLTREERAMCPFKLEKL